MIKKIYSKKDDTWIRMERSLYKRLSKVMTEDQIAEFYLTFDRYLHDDDNMTIKSVIIGMIAFANLINSPTFMEDLNRNTDSNGNVDWKSIVDMYKNVEDPEVIHR